MFQVCSRDHFECQSVNLYIALMERSYNMIAIQNIPIFMSYQIYFCMHNIIYGGVRVR